MVDLYNDGARVGEEELAVKALSVEEKANYERELLRRDSIIEDMVARRIALDDRVEESRSRIQELEKLLREEKGKRRRKSFDMSDVLEKLGVNVVRTLLKPTFLSGEKLNR